MKKISIIKNFLTCGVIGWCLEIIFTGLQSLRKREMTLKGTTSLWMFPIYGCAALLRPLFKILAPFPAAIRGTIYAASIFCGEYISGHILTSKQLCPWDYQKCKWNIHGIIRIDFLPYWFLTGLLFERVLTQSSKHHS